MSTYQVVTAPAGKGGAVELGTLTLAAGQTATGVQAVLRRGAFKLVPAGEASAPVVGVPELKTKTL